MNRLSLKAKLALAISCFLVLVCEAALYAYDEEEEEYGREEKSYSIYGYYKNFFTAIQNPRLNELEKYEDIAPHRVDGIVINSLRLNFFWKPISWFNMQLAYALSPEARAQKSPDALFANSFSRHNPLSYRAYDLRERLYPWNKGENSHFILNNNIDRVLFVFSAPFMDFLIGRQPVAFGSARAVNPTDVLAPFTYEALDKEERVGVDAVRLKVPIGAMGEFDAGYIFGEEFKFKNSAFFGRIKFYLLETDISVIGIGFCNNLLAGLDIARAIGGASVWIEAAYVFAELLNDYLPKENYFRLSLGADYNLADDLYGFIEYHFNGAGELRPENYFENNTAYQKGGVYLLGQHYVAPGLSYQITPLLTFSPRFLMNLTDPSAFVSAAFEYNFAQDVFLDVGAFIALGKSADVTFIEPVEGIKTPLPMPNSEFGIYPNIYYASIRLYF